MFRRILFFCVLSTGFLDYSYSNDWGTYGYEEYPLSSNSSGGIGLIENPTARFSDDGQLSFGISTTKPFNRIYAKIQFFPWLESSVRYTENTSVPYNPGSKQTWKDKGIDLKIRLFKERNYLPQMALGLLDFGGTGGYAGEYLVASKRVKNIDYTLGIGWGRFDGNMTINNPFKHLNESYAIRGGNKSTGLGGTLGLNRLFTGEKAGIFGGIEYYTHIPNLSMKLEYDADDYDRELGKKLLYHEESEVFKVDSKINLGINYRINIFDRDKLDLQLAFERGNTLYLNASLHSNLNYQGRQKYRAPKEILNKPYLQPFNELNEEWKNYLSELIIWQMGNEGLVTHNLVFQDNEMQAEISQSRFRKPIKAIDLASRILGNNSPTNIEKITVINIDQGIETLRATIPRSVLVEQVSKGPLEEQYLIFDPKQAPTTNKAIIIPNDYLYPNFYWSIRPNMTGTLQHQIKFYFWQLEALLHATYSIRQGLYLSTDIGIKIDNNFEDYTYHIPDGKLYHVRQDRRLYLTEGESGIRRLALDYVFDINSNIKSIFSAGLIEWMYGGIGGEVLYMPDNKQWALGVDAYWVKQRDFDQKFSFKDYETTTSFVNFYYNLPFYNMRFKAGVGKFLGKDNGVNIDISRRFETGAKVGAMLSLTDCDASCVGEGSFNKWIYFTLPMDLFHSSNATRNKAHYAWSPLTKDAGQRIEPGRLFNIMSNASDEIDSFQKEDVNIKKAFCKVKKSIVLNIDGMSDCEIQFSDIAIKENIQKTDRRISLKKVFSGFNTHGVISKTMH
mgnify:CR=1 FL=1|jgi:hypothetical protein